MNVRYHTPDLNRVAFARTNPQTLNQRVAILRELLPDVKSIAEICCGDCSRQWEVYHRALDIKTYCGLDIQPEIAAANRAKGIDCVCGDALDRATLSRFRAFDVIFFGPPLSVNCDGHTLLSFHEVVPGFACFAHLLLGELLYSGTLVCICPKATTMGDVRWLYTRVKEQRQDVGLRLIHYSYSTVTGADVVTESRLKYVELWFSDHLDDMWEVRKSEASAIPN
jgi:hypothetical protein